MARERVSFRLKAQELGVRLPCGSPAPGTTTPQSLLGHGQFIKENAHHLNLIKCHSPSISAVMPRHQRRAKVAAQILLSTSVTLALVGFVIAFWKISGLLCNLTTGNFLPCVQTSKHALNQLYTEGGND